MFIFSRYLILFSFRLVLYLLILIKIEIQFERAVRALGLADVRPLDVTTCGRIEWLLVLLFIYVLLLLLFYFLCLKIS